MSRLDVAVAKHRQRYGAGSAGKDMLENNVARVLVGRAIVRVRDAR